MPYTRGREEGRKGEVNGGEGNERKEREVRGRGRKGKGAQH
jgi:hypothetical protein